MFGSLFGFGGRMGRLRYFGAISFTTTLSVAWIVLLLMGFGVAIAKGSGGAFAGAGLLAVFSAIPLVWMFLAITTKRLRDAGFPPAIVLPIFIGFSVIEPFLLVGHVAGQPSAALLQTSMLGISVKTVFGLVLQFWPSAAPTAAKGDRDEKPSGTVPWHERALALASILPPEPAPVAGPASISDPLPARGQPRSFGRRGL